MKCVRGVMKCIFENDISFAVCVEESFTDAVDCDWFGKFFVGVEVVLVTGHRVSTTGIIYPNVFVG